MGHIAMFADIVHLSKLAESYTDFPEPTYANGGHDALDGSIFVPTQGFNIFSAVSAKQCAGDATKVGNIYCLGSYKDDGDASGVNANAAASYIGREWSDLAPVDADLPGGTAPA